MRLWASNRDCVDTGCGGTTGRGNAQGNTVWHLLDPVRPSPAIRPHGPLMAELTTDHRDTTTFPTSPDDTHMALPHHDVRRTIPPALTQYPIGPLTGMPGFLEPRREATARVASILIS